jgi:hypothetical protein
MITQHANAYQLSLPKSLFVAGKQYDVHYTEVQSLEFRSLVTTTQSVP